MVLRSCSCLSNNLRVSDPKLWGMSAILIHSMLFDYIHSWNTEEDGSLSGLNPLVISSPSFWPLFRFRNKIGCFLFFLDIAKPSAFLTNADPFGSLGPSPAAVAFNAQNHAVFLRIEESIRGGVSFLHKLMGDRPGHSPRDFNGFQR